MKNRHSVLMHDMMHYDSYCSVRLHIVLLDFHWVECGLILSFAEGSIAEGSLAEGSIHTCKELIFIC